MMSVLGDVSLERAGFEPELRDRIAAAWRAEDFHDAGALIPDELLDAFMLCGTREDVAAGAMAFHAEAGPGPAAPPAGPPGGPPDRRAIARRRALRGLPEPATAGHRRRAAQPQPRRHSGRARRRLGPAGLADDRTLGLGDRAGRRLGALWEILRPFAYTASVIPVRRRRARGRRPATSAGCRSLAALLGGVLLHSGTNIINEIYDVRKGIDTITSPRASHAILKGRLTERQAFVAAFVAFALAIARRRLPRSPCAARRSSGLGLLGLLGGYFYTAPPFEYKYRALGVPLVFVLMGPLMVVGTYFAVTGTWSVDRPGRLGAGRPAGRGHPGRQRVARHQRGQPGRHLDAVVADRPGRAHYFYVGLVLGAYMALG